VAVDVALTALPEEPLRSRWGDPPRVELQAQLPLTCTLPLRFADRLDRIVSLPDLPPDAQEAISLLADSSFGRQLSDAERDIGGWCQTASLRFLAALREKGSDGHLLSWGGPSEAWWHCTVQLVETDIVVDWTARQFDGNAPLPRIETRAVAEARWGIPGWLDPDTRLGRSLGALPAVPTWADAQRARSTRA
jgi:hypothetical protein